MKKLMIVAAVVAAVTTASQAKAEWNMSPFGIGLCAPIQVPWVSSNIYGLRIGGLCGYNNDVYGLDVGVMNMADGNTGALNIGAVNIVYGEATGWQIGAAGYNSSFAGFEVNGLINWNCYDSYGWQISTVNANQQNFTGFLLGAINYSGLSKGLSIGAINAAYENRGLQIGVVNACDKCYGVQIGAFNIIASSPLPIMLIANASF